MDKMKSINKGRITLSGGKKALEGLISSLLENTKQKNEAETRFHIIDTLVQSCFGWPKELIHVEVTHERKFSDYELGKPRQVIWEAKREGKTFELPSNPQKNYIVDLPSILAFGKETEEAILQVQSYCSQRGVQLGVVTNGHQIIAFLSTRFDGIPPLEGKAVVIRSLEHLYNEFHNLWQLLSFDGICEKRIIRLLLTGQSGLPVKLSSKLINYPKIRYQSDIQTTLKQLSELLIQDIIESSNIEEQFFNKCYCESGALSKYALVSKSILEARYAAMFSEKEPHPHATSVKPQKNDYAFTPEVMTEAISRRPIVLIGDVGVGKTSFVKHLMYTTAYQEFKNALYIYIDLGSKASLSQNLNNFILHEIEEQLDNKYEVDVNDIGFIKGVYAQKISKFSKGLYGPYKEKNPEKYEEKLIKMLEELIFIKDQHLKNALNHISKSNKKQIIICLDNADQRSFEVQQQSFIIAQELAKEWKATVFISVRPQTFYKSKQAGALTAYPHKVFTISPPRVDVVIEKRLLFALKMAEGKIPVETIPNVNLNSLNLAYFLKALIYSLKNNKKLTELISNITGGNIRAVIELVTSFIGSPNVNAEKIIEIMENDGNYLIPVHEFSKSALLGDYSHYNPESSIAMNIFDVLYPDPKEHFLIGMILGFLNSESDYQDKDGFFFTSAIMEEFQALGFTQDQIEDSLRRATNKKVIETSQRITFAEDETGLIGDIPSLFRITTVGAYHLKRWISTFAYLDAMVFDTPIFEDSTIEKLLEQLESFNIIDRFNRALEFKKYLLSIWASCNFSVRYFDFDIIMNQGNESFAKVKSVIDRNNKAA